MQTMCPEMCEDFKKLRVMKTDDDKFEANVDQNMPLKDSIKTKTGCQEHRGARGKESKSDSHSSGEQNGSNLNRENGVVRELYKCRAARRSSRECCTLNGESPVAESITSLHSDPSSMGMWNLV
ncbi:hypothetical protein JHK82_025016 [Glycine max]|nr:hypothetical protein JHK85_025633 [Glycine max]KAG5133828.1 hypothetical protein JHK82_025016 [Glycine max]